MILQVEPMNDITRSSTPTDRKMAKIALFAGSFDPLPVDTRRLLRRRYDSLMRLLSVSARIFPKNRFSRLSNDAD